MKVDPYATLIALVRQQMPRAAPAVAQAYARKSQQAGNAPRFDLARTVVERIREIAPDDPRRRRKAFRVFLEGVLADEFGAALLTDPGYQQLVDLVLDQMEAEPSVEEPMARAIDVLLG